MLFVSAWPMCKAPVTFGGGMTITNLGFDEPCFGVKKPRCSHHEYQPASTTRGQYALAIAPLVLLHCPGGSACTSASAAASSACSAASLAAFSSASACLARKHNNRQAQLASTGHPMAAAVRARV